MGLNVERIRELMQDDTLPPITLEQAAGARALLSASPEGRAFLESLRERLPVDPAQQ